jgi:WD40 repeat protein
MIRHSLVLVSLLAGCSFGDEGRPEMAIGTNPIALYEVNDGSLEERRSGVDPAWAPDGERLAHIGDHDGNVWVENRSFPLGITVDGSLEWTPDGRSLVIERGGIRLLDVETGAERLLRPGTLPALSPDGRAVAYLRIMRQNGTGIAIGSSLRIAPLKGGKPQVLARTVGGPSGSHFDSRPQWLPDGRGIAVARRAGEQDEWVLEVVGLDRRRRVVVPRLGQEFAWAPDGELIAYQLTGFRDGLVIAKPGRPGKVYGLGKLRGETGPFSVNEYGGLAWSPDGEEVAFYLGGEDKQDRSMLLVYALDVTSGKIRHVARIRDAGTARIAWNPQP